MNDSSKQALLFGIIGVALTSFIGYHNIYRPIQTQVKVIKQQVFQENNERKAKVELDQQLDLVAEYKKLLPPAAEISWLVKQMVNAGRETGVEFDSLVPGGLIRMGAVTKIPLRVKFKASYRELGMLVEHLENNPHYIRIDSLSVQESGAARVVRYSQLNRGNAEKGIYDKDGWIVTSVSLSVSTLYIPPLFPGNDQSEVSL